MNAGPLSGGVLMVGSLRSGSGRLSRVAILLYAVIVMAIGWGYGLWRIHQDRAVALHGSHQQLATLAKALGLQINAMVGDGLGAAIAGAGVSGDLPDAQTARVLQQMLTGGEYVRAVFVARSDTLVAAHAPGEQLSLVDADWNEELRRSAAPTWVGAVMHGAGQELLLPIAHRIDEASSIWAGTLIRVSDLDAVYAELQDTRTSVSLITPSGRLLVQIPASATSLPNQDLRDSGIYRQYMDMPVQPITLMEGAHPVTGVPRQFAIYRIEGLPIVATAGRSIGDTLSDWHRRTVVSLQVMGGATLAVFGLAIALQLLLNRRWSALQKSERRFELAAAGANDGLFEWESDTGQVYLTARARELLRLPEDATPGPDALLELLHPDDAPGFTTAVRRHVDDGERLDLQLRLRAGDAYRWFRFRGQAEWNERHEPLRLAGAIGDIHDTVEAQQAVAAARHAELEAKQSLARELLAAQERGRKRLASDLHDGVGQTLSLLRNRVILLRRTGLPAEAMPHTQSLLDLATEAIEDLRNVAQNLRPMHLEELGVTTALHALLERVARSSDLDVRFRIEDVDDVIEGPAATHVYRIAQEAIHNVLRHAGARHLWVEVIRDIAMVEISIRDDGRGMPGGSAARHDGLGLLSIAERCAMLGAQLEVKDNAPAGTCLRVRIPVGAGPEDAVQPLPGSVHA